jgi:hypothetical protein
MNELQFLRIFSFVTTYQLLRTLSITYRYKRLLLEQNMETERIVTYFGDVLKRNEVPIEEFDIIALRDMGVRVNLAPPKDGE